MLEENNHLNEAEIEIILNALHLSKETLLTVYTKDWLQVKMNNIMDKLDAQQKELERNH
ncbi:hypothetical protein ACFPES_01020 [Paenibacillus sp. GCM10023248]|uniref:hypothetical protein n=1 Tax=Bacillales TaxID=1385 RepID=UPI0023782252|nr:MULTISPECIES: hypothetical protein [Bacillales]MDD9265604.1 hypothetical protein [Paenibacillus sp. MAHUQ-63]MDR6878842.1 hypothetical protein [Bacillus sp. 3255]